MKSICIDINDSICNFQVHNYSEFETLKLQKYVNSIGLRSPEPVNDDCLNIALVGDSVVWGYQLKFNETMSAQLDQYLNANTQNCFHVHNVAMSGIILIKNTNYYKIQ